MHMQIGQCRGAGGLEDGIPLYGPLYKASEWQSLPNDVWSSEPTIHHGEYKANFLMQRFLNAHP